ncbi:MAG: peptidoglycan-associated lipoprotein Pal [Deltaproteobacteria bacterium]|nr:peptidoglycan-associated lipoprotein Pal [Deltaproteobacteria bacterium]
MRKKLLSAGGVVFFILALTTYGCTKKLVKEEIVEQPAVVKEIPAEVKVEKGLEGGVAREKAGVESKKVEEGVAEKGLTEEVIKEKPIVVEEKTSIVEAKVDTKKDELIALIEKEGRLLPIYFDFDRFSIRDDARPILERNASWLKKNLAIKVQVQGHADERGSNEYNLALGERRSQSARGYLVDLGIEPARLSTITYGEERPADPGHSEEAWAKNRRVEFVIIQK